MEPQGEYKDILSSCRIERMNERDEESVPVVEGNNFLLGPNLKIVLEMILF